MAGPDVPITADFAHKAADRLKEMVRQSVDMAHALTRGLNHPTLHKTIAASLVTYMLRDRLSTAAIALLRTLVQLVAGVVRYGLYA